MTDPVAFGEARLAEDWRAADTLETACKIPDKIPDFTSAGGPAAEAYWQHFSARRALRDVEIDRATLALHEPDEFGCQVCPPGVDSLDGLCRTYRLVLSRWDDHPDYDQGWKP